MDFRFSPYYAPFNASSGTDEPKIEYGYDPVFEETAHDEQWTDHATVSLTRAQNCNFDGNAEPVIGFSKEDVNFIHYKLPQNRKSHKNVFYEMMESSAEHGYHKSYQGITGGANYGPREEDIYVASMSEGVDASQFEPIIGFSKDDIL